MVDHAASWICAGTGASPRASSRRRDLHSIGFARRPAVPRLNVGVIYCTTRLENTHGTDFRELLYPWHPWFGLRVCVHQAIDKSGSGIFRCTLSGSDADRWLEVPAWMFDRSPPRQPQ